MGTRPGRDMCRGLPGRAPQAQSRHLAMAGGPGRGIRRHLGDVATTNGGDALPPRPGEVGRFPRRLTGPPPGSAPLSTVGQGQRWERKRCSPKPSQLEHWDFDAAEAEICRIFAETRQKLHTLWAVPCIINASYPRVVRTRVATLCLEGPGAGSSNELTAPGQGHLRDQSPRKKLPATGLPTLIALSPEKAWGRVCYWSPLQSSCASTPSNLLSPGKDV
jgi:hypothetical protein